MDISKAQTDVRRVFRYGFIGTFISACVWILSSIMNDAVSPGSAVITLFIGGALIFPLTTLVLKLIGGPSALPKGHPMAALATQIAMTVPIGILLVIVLTASQFPLFFCASMILVGAHYLPFIFLYGMKMYFVLSMILIFSATLIIFSVPALLPISGWIGSGIFLFFSFVFYTMNRRHPLLES